MIIIALTFYANINYRNIKYLDNDCSTSLIMRDRINGFYIKTNIYIDFSKDSTGYLDMSGNISINDEVYTIARSWRFEYEFTSKDTLYLTDFKMDKRAVDNSPDDLVNKQVFNTFSNQGRYLKIGNMNGAWSIGNLYSPVFLCILRNK